MLHIAILDNIHTFSDDKSSLLLVLTNGKCFLSTGIAKLYME